MKINNIATALCVLVLESTAVRAALYTTTFTFHKGDDGSGDRVGPKDIDPEPPSGVQTCARWGQDDGIRSVVIDRSGVDLGNTDYCIYGYEALDCGPLRAVAKTWPGPDDKASGIFNFKDESDRKVQSVMVVEGRCEDIEGVTLSLMNQ